MNYVHYKNDFTVDINLSSITTGLTIDPDVIYSIKFYTRKNGVSYKCCFMNNTLVKHDGFVTAVLNQSCLEPGVLHYVVEYQINDSTYPDAHKRIFLEFTSDIELCKGNGDTLDIDVLAMFGDTIDDKFNSYDASILALGTAEAQLSASILSVQEINSIQDASINRIEDIIATIDGGTSGTIDRLDASVNALLHDVSALNRSVDTLSSEQEIMSQNLTNVSNKVNDISTLVDGFESALANKADVSVLGNYYTTGETYTKTEVDRAIADAALDGSLPAGVVVDADYVHTDNNYTNEDKAKVQNFDLTGYPTNSSLVANYATKAELQSVDDNHPTNASVNATYLKKTELANELTDYVQNTSLVANYATKDELTDYVQNASLVANYATKEELLNIDLQDYYTKGDVSLMLAAKADVSNGWIDQNGIYNGQQIRAMTLQAMNGLSIGDPTDVGTGRNGCVGLFNLDHTLMITDMTQDSSHNVLLEYKFPVTTPGEPFVHKQIATIDYTYSQDAIDQLLAEIQNQQTEDGELITDLSTNIKQLNNNLETNYVSNASLSDKVNNLNLTTYVKNASLNETLGNYVLTSTAQTTYATKDDISTFITSNDASVYLTSNDISTFVTEDDLDYILSNDYYTQGYIEEEFAHLSDISDFITSDDASVYLTDNDVSQFITSNDVSNRLTSNDVSTFATTTYVDTQIGNIQNILATI